MANRAFAEDCLRATNEHRVKHHVEPLKYNVELETIAQKWAEHLAKVGAMSHNPNRKFRDGIMGENCAMKWSSDNTDYSGAEATDQWYDEIQKYDFKTHEGPNTGHFTQLVWNGTREVGVGRAQSRDGKWFAVADYFPAGNIVGHYAENVFPSSDKNSVVSRNNKTAHKGHGPSEQEIRRDVRTETTGRGATATIRTIVVETIKYSDGSSKTTRSETVTTGEPISNNNNNIV